MHPAGGGDKRWSPFRRQKLPGSQVEPGGSLLESKALVLLNDLKGVALLSHDSCVGFYFELYVLPLRLHFNVRRLISFGIDRFCIMPYDCLKLHFIVLVLLGYRKKNDIS